MKLRALLENLILVTLVSLICELVYDVVSVTNLTMFFLLAVIVAALRWGAAASAMVSLLSFASLDLAVLPPRFQFGTFDRQYFITLAVFLLVGQIISRLAQRSRQQAEAARQREMQTSTLYAFSRDVSATDDPQEIIAALHKRLSPWCVGPAAIALDDNGPDGIPLRTGRGDLGRVHFTTPPLPENRHLVESLCSQAALALEHLRMADEVQRNQVLEATEKLQTALLNSVSHDLHTPLASLSGSLDMLADPDVELGADTRKSLLELAREQSGRLRRLVNNLLDMTRVEAGGLRLNIQPTEPADLIGAALEHCREVLEGATLKLEVADDLPTVPVDFVLMVQVLSNLIENAVKYSGENSQLEIAVSVDEHFVIKVRDRGVGIPAVDLERIFERFYRVQAPDKVRGSGLGLSISKGIVECHGGTIRAANRSGGGTEVTIDMPRG